MAKWLPVSNEVVMVNMQIHYYLYEAIYAR